ncbi:MAG: efflux RND transporter periplasmic adaptor subunit [Bacteroidales bacterium]|nr:efflux RND transporter periplasmic adaptor subunit [Bacteroidales bacterium]MCF8390946.1 efflux RND transporter periplasmic adaptor subunit [Bacteroidales bacterium]
MKSKQLKNGLYLAIFLLASACSHSTSDTEIDAEEAGQLLKITAEEFEYNKMQTGMPVKQFFEETINCTGFIKAETGGIAQISSPVSGILSSIHCSLGDYVKKGQVLGLISSNELILMQQEFIETSVGLNQVKADYERIKILYDDNIAAKKEFLAVVSQYKTMTAKYNSLKLRLENMRLNTEKIEKGELYAEFPVAASISGHISKQNMILGQYVEPQNRLTEIVNVDKLQLNISVFESDINKLKIGQNISFNVFGEKNFSHAAQLTSIGKTIDTDTKAIECLAKIKAEKDFSFINQSYIEARIVVDRQEKNSIPTEAIIKLGDEYFVYVVEKKEGADYFLKKHTLIPGKTNGSFTEISESADLKDILISGVYNLPVE